MAAIILRQTGSLTSPEATVKGAPLSNLEVDNNFSNLNISVGVLSNLSTTEKSNLVAAINETFQTGGASLLSGNLSQFASTTSEELATVISDEVGTGNLVFSNSPTFSGTPQAVTAANLTSNSMVATTEYVLNSLGSFAGSDSPVFSGNVVIPQAFILANISLPRGTLSAPSLTFHGDTNTGIYSPTLDSLSIAIAGSQRFNVNPTSTFFTEEMDGPSGLTSNPTYGFTSDSDTGMYLTTTGQLGFTVGGSRRLNVTTTQIESTEPFAGPDGSVSEPTFSFDLDTNTGIYRTGTDAFAVTCGGTQEVIWTTSGEQATSLGVGTAPSGTTGEIRATNNITAYYSDQRLKKDITPIKNALEKIEQISGVYFKANEKAAEFGYDTNEQQVGVIAQEIEKVLPEVVVAAPFDTVYDNEGNQSSLSGENYKTVRYEKIVPLLIEAIKDLKKEIDSLK